MNPQTPLAASLTALITDLGAVGVGFGLLNNTTVGFVVTAVTALVTTTLVIVNEVRHKTLLAAGQLPRR